MRVFISVLVAVLLCLDRGSEQKQTKSLEESADEDYDYKDDDDEDDDEDEVEIKHIPYEGSLECYTCESESIEERCNKIQTCSPSQTFCKTIISKGNAESNYFTTFSAWCSDTCKEATKIIEGTHVTVNCCQSDMCNPLSLEGQSPDMNSKTASHGGILTGPICAHHQRKWQPWGQYKSLFLLQPTSAFHHRDPIQGLHIMRCYCTSRTPNTVLILPQPTPRALCPSSSARAFNSDSFIVLKHILIEANWICLLSIRQFTIFADKYFLLQELK